MPYHCCEHCDPTHEQPHDHPYPCLRTQQCKGRTLIEPEVTMVQGLREAWKRLFR